MNTTEAFSAILVTVVLTIIYAVGSVRAATVYQQPLANNLDGLFSNVGGQHIADSVSVATPISVTHITWYGFYGIDLNPGITSLDFLVRFFPDDGGAPRITPDFAQWFSAGIQSTGQRVNMPGQPSDGRLIYRLDTDLPSPFLVPAGVTEWLSVSDGDPSTPSWLWARSSVDPNVLAYGIAGDSWSTRTDLGQTAFALDGVVVPEPSTWRLLLMSLIGVCCVCRARKYAATKRSRRLAPV